MNMAFSHASISSPPYSSFPWNEEKRHGYPTLSRCEAALEPVFCFVTVVVQRDYWVSVQMRLHDAS